MFPSTDKINRARRHFLGLAGSASAKLATIGGLAAVPSLIAGIASAHRGGNGKGRGHHRCFLRGTMIATPAGEIAVEGLKAGDLVHTAGGQPMAVKWIGRQAFGVSRNNLPIRISRHALEDNRPHADLYVSPHHALLIDGVLIRAKDLVNGTTIAPALPAGRDTIEYYHILLDSHEVVLAEGVPAETLLLEADNHEAFSNFAELTRLFPDGTIPAMAPVAPILQYRGRDHLRALLRLAFHPFAADDDPIETIHVRLAKRAEVVTA